MPAPLISEDEFVELFTSLGTNKMARKTGINKRNILQRRQRIEQARGIELNPPNGRDETTIPSPKLRGQIELEIRNGVVIVASDAHYEPKRKTLMHKALVKFCRDIKPHAVVMNGDVMDFPSISRHSSIMWEKRPKVIEEIEWAQDMLHEITMAAGKNCKRIWTFGNHDQRFESRIANLAPEYAKVHGVHLHDHFPSFEPCWNVVINPDTNDNTQINHRYRGGIHAVHNNLLWSGGHTITGHLHSAQVRPLTYRGGRTIWGMDTGCLAEPHADSFGYLENNPRNWRSAFGILTYKDGKLMQPELVLKWSDTEIQFRGSIIKP